MRINEPDLHYVLCTYLFNKFNNGVKFYFTPIKFTPTILSKKVPAWFIFNTIVLIISLKYLKTRHCKPQCNSTHSPQAFRAGIVSKKKYRYVLVSENADRFT